MSDVKLTGKIGESKESKGLKDGGLVSVTCSCCKEQLGEIWIVDSRNKTKELYRFECGFCGDHSFVQEITGTVYIAAIEGHTTLQDFDCKEINGKLVRIVYTGIYK